MRQINTIYTIQNYQECRVIMNLVNRRGLHACYTGVTLNFIEIDHANQQATYSDKASFANKVVAMNLTDLIKRM